MATNIFAMDDIGGERKAFKDTYEQNVGMMNDFNRLRAGRAYGQGDRVGAAQVLAQGGNIEDARVIQGDMRNEARQAQTDARQAMQDQRQVTQDEAAMQKEQAALMLRILPKLKTLAPGQRAAALQRAAPLLQQVGAKPEDLSKLTEDMLSDEQIDIAIGDAEVEIEEYTLPPGAQRWRGNQMIADNPRQPTAPAGMRYSADGVLENIPGYVASRAAVSGATRAPPRASGGGGVRSNIPPPPSGWRTAAQ